jgi:hypothetical protein
MKEHTLPNRLDANMLDCAERLQVPILRVVRRSSPEWCGRVRVSHKLWHRFVALLLMVEGANVQRGRGAVVGLRNSNLILQTSRF